MLIRARNCADAVLLQAAADGNLEVLKQRQQSIKNDMLSSFYKVKL